MSKFGIEIECFNLPTFPQEIRTLGWIRKDDGSIRGSYSAEIVSPPLEFTKQSLKEVKEVMRLLREAGAEVNRSCGLHVHIDLRETMTKCHASNLFNTLVKRYADNEEQIDNLVPRSRRGNRNSFCNSMTNMDLENNLGESVTVNDQIIENLNYLNRYRKINISSFPRHGTVEFRHFGATLNGTKTVAWIHFCQSFVKAAKRHTLLENKREMTEVQWLNPYYLMRNQNSIRYLQLRAAEAIADVIAREEAAAARIAEATAVREAEESARLNELEEALQVVAE